MAIGSSLFLITPFQMQNLFVIVAIRLTSLASRQVDSTAATIDTQLFLLIHQCRHLTLSQHFHLL